MLSFSGQVGEWLKPPDCKSGPFGVRWFESNPAHHITCVRFISGGVAEWLKAAVLKTAVPLGTVGSNPTPSANIFHLYFGVCIVSIRDHLQGPARFIGIRAKDGTTLVESGDGFVRYRKGIVYDDRGYHPIADGAHALWYCAPSGFEFPVPLDDTGDADFLVEYPKAITLMRYIRHHLGRLAD